MPLAAESYGRMGRAASRFLSRLGDIAAASDRASKAAFVAVARQELSVAMCRGNERIFYKARSGVASVVGQHYLPGLDVPTDEHSD